MNDAVNKNDVEIVEFEPRYGDDFARLNYQWIEEYFVIEDHDREMLDDPVHYIIEPGGQIFFAIEDGAIIGTVALIDEGSQMFELAKMAVAKEARGKGIGDLLIEACISYSRRKRMRSLFLLSNTKLAPAIGLYKKHGFVETDLDPDTPYERVDIRMQLHL